MAKRRRDLLEFIDLVMVISVIILCLCVIGWFIQVVKPIITGDVVLEVEELNPKIGSTKRNPLLGAFWFL